MIKENELNKGIKQEFEHTSNYRTAKKIAMDHLREDPMYYKKLKKCFRKNKSILGNSKGLLSNKAGLLSNKY